MNSKAVKNFFVEIKPRECRISEGVDVLYQMQVKVLNSTLQEVEENENLNLKICIYNAIFAVILKVETSSNEW